MGEFGLGRMVLRVERPWLSLMMWMVPLRAQVIRIDLAFRDISAWSLRFSSDLGFDLWLFVDLSRCCGARLVEGDGIRGG